MKDFIIIGNKNAMLWKSIFPKYFRKELYFGYNQVSRFFFLPDDATEWDKMEGGKKTNWFQGSGRWFTTFPTYKKNPPLPLLPYDPRVHKKYDTYDAVNTDSIYNIPNYDGLIGVPIGIIDYLCPEQFEIVGILCRGSDETLDPAKPIIDGKCLYTRVLIRRRLQGG